MRNSNSIILKSIFVIVGCNTYNSLVPNVNVIAFTTTSSSSIVAILSRRSRRTIAQLPKPLLYGSNSPFNEYNDSLFDEADDEEKEDHNNNNNNIDNDEGLLLFADIEAARKRFEISFVDRKNNKKNKNKNKNKKNNDNALVFSTSKNENQNVEVVNNHNHDEKKKKKQLFNVEAARDHLEVLMMMQTTTKKNDVESNNNAATATVATQTEVKKEEVEAELLLFQENSSISFLRPYLNPEMLRALVSGDDIDDDDNNLFINLPPSPITTTSSIKDEEQYRYKEMELLKQLLTTTKDAADDIVLNDLYNLWYNTKGPKAAKILEQVDMFIDRHNYDDAEQLLQHLIQDYDDIYWTEPIHCLANLWYIQGKNYIQCEILYKWVIINKPWHFGAISGLVRIYETKKQTKLACQWASKRLPSPSNRGHRRISWIQKALIQSGESLKLLLLSSSSSNTNNPSSTSNIINKDDDALSLFTLFDNDNENDYDNNKNENDNAWQ